MRGYLEEAERSGYRRALASITDKFPDLSRYLLSQSRTDWLYHCLDGERRGTCLDIGSGWGSNSFGLADFYDEVWSLEMVRERVEFQRIRKKQDAKDNINIVRSDWMSLPFEAESFDLVVCNGVLEWAGLNEDFENPRDAQIHFLSEINRVLRKDGCLYIGIENRTGLNNFRGARDHSGLKYTSVMPRFLADMVVRRSNRNKEDYTRDKRVSGRARSYRTYTYTVSGYRQLLRDTGFPVDRVYWTGSYNLPKYSGPIDDGSYPFFVRKVKPRRTNSHGSVGARLKGIATGLTPGPILAVANSLLTPSYLIYAYKRQRGTPFEDELLGPSSGRTSRLMMGSGHGKSSKMTYFVAEGMDLKTVMKFARFRAGDERLDEEERRLAEHCGVRISKEIVDGVTVHHEPPLSGRPMDPNDPEQLRMATEWLLGFQTNNDRGTLDVDLVESEIETCSRAVEAASLEKEQAKEILDSVRRFASDLRETGIHACAEHGDFFFGNVLIDDARRVSVIDWEFYKDSGMPLFDFSFSMIACATSGTNPEGLVALLDANDERGRRLRAEIEEYARKKGIPAKLVFDSIPCVILKCMARESGSEGHYHLRGDYYGSLLRTWMRSAKGVRS
jgi:SAM-dependent methyltransferase/thiamine kinase-like enzyme